MKRLKQSEEIQRISQLMMDPGCVTAVVIAEEFSSRNAEETFYEEDTDISE